MRLKRIKHLKNVCCIAFSVFLLVAGLWQLEIVEFRLSLGLESFDWPFYVFPSVGIWFARDVMYSVIILAFIIQFFSLWFWD
jgi:hypothetical protein